MKTIAVIQFEETKAGNIVAYSIVQGKDGRYYLQCFSDYIAGRGFTIRAWLTSNGAFRHLAKLITPIGI